MLPWWAWSVAASCSVIAVEYLNHHARTGSAWLPTLAWTLAPIVLAQYGLFRSWSEAPHWFVAWVAFSLGTATIRVATVAAVSSGQVESWSLTLLGVLVMWGGALLVHVGAR